MTIRSLAGISTTTKLNQGGVTKKKLRKALGKRPAPNCRALGSREGLRSVRVKRAAHLKMPIEERQARMKGCQVLVSLLDCKAKLLGMDPPVKVEPPPVVVPETEEQRSLAAERSYSSMTPAATSSSGMTIRGSSDRARPMGQILVDDMD